MSSPQNESQVESHYTQVSRTYNSHCFYRDNAFNEFICTNVLNLLPKKTKTLCDIGSGTGQFANFLCKRLNMINGNRKGDECKIYCVEPSKKMLSQTPKSPYLVPIQNSANNFFTFKTVSNNVNTINLSINPSNSLKFDTIYFKESIHHIIETSELQELFSHIYDKLNENGICIIITRPHSLSSNYPFSNVMRYYWQQYVPNPMIYRRLLSKYFGTKNCQIIETQYPFKVLAKDWISMMKDRFWSMLSKLSEYEINDGIDEIIKKHSIRDVNQDYFEFDDTITFVVARKRTMKPYLPQVANNDFNTTGTAATARARVDTAAPALGLSKL